jgi:hypothetical protein
MTLTNEQKLAFTVFGMMIASEPQLLLEHMSNKKLVALCGDVSDYISPLVNDDIDLVTPAISVLQSLIEQLKKD